MGEQAQPGQRRSRARRVAAGAALGVVGLALALVLAIACVPRLVPDRVLGRVVARRLGAALGREATVEAARLAPGVGVCEVWVRGVSVARRQGFDDGELARLGFARARVRLLPLLIGTVRLTKCELHEIELTVVRDGQGVVNIHDLLERPWPRRRWLEVDGIAAYDGRLDYRDLGRDLSQSLLVPYVVAGPPVDGARPVCAKVALPQGGEATADGRVWLTPGAAELDRAELELEAEAQALDLDAILAVFQPGLTALPECPKGLRATFEATAGKLVYDGRTFERVRLEGRLADDVVEVAELAAHAGQGTARATARIALGGDWRHTLALDLQRMPLDQDFALLHKLPVVGSLPFLNIVHALLGGKPERLSFLATATASLRAQGAEPQSIRSSLAGEGDVALHELRFTGSPLFRSLAALFRRPEVADLLLFERADAPFTVRDGRIRNTATVPYQGGAFHLDGSTTLGGEVDYRLYVHNPKGIEDIPEELAAFLDAGNPIVLITGTGDAPRTRIPTEAIVDFAVKHKLHLKLRDRLRQGLQGPKPRPRPDEGRDPPDKATRPPGDPRRLP